MGLHRLGDGQFVFPVHPKDRRRATALGKDCHRLILGKGNIGYAQAWHRMAAIVWQRRLALGYGIGQLWRHVSALSDMATLQFYCRNSQRGRKDVWDNGEHRFYPV